MGFPCEGPPGPGLRAPRVPAQVRFQCGKCHARDGAEMQWVCGECHAFGLCAGCVAGPWVKWHMQSFHPKRIMKAV